MVKLIELLPDRAIPRALAGVKFDRVLVKPGINYQLSPAQVEKLLSHTDFQRYVGNGSINVIESEVDPSAEEIEPQEPLSQNVDLSGFKVGEDKGETGDIIRKTTKLDILDRWLSKETRKTVQGQLQRRITAIKGGQV